MYHSIPNNARWTNSPPTALGAGLIEAAAQLIATVKAGGGRAGPFSRTSEPVELDDGYLMVSLTRSGGIVVHWEPYPEADDEDEQPVLN